MSALEAPPPATTSPSSAAHAKGAVAGYPCEHCGGKTRFLPGTEALQCVFCQALMPIARGAVPVSESDFEQALRARASMPLETLTVGAREIECKTCGARSVVTEQALRCAFCDATVVVEVPPGDAIVMPGSVLPFAKTGSEAQAALTRWIDGLWFAPFRLRRRAKTLAIDGIYLPFWTFDTQTHTAYHGQRGDYYYVSVSYRDAQGRSQTRQERRTAWRPASGEVAVAFDDTLVCASRSVPQRFATKLEPWDLAALAPFDGRYLAGFIAERYAIDLAEGFAVAETMMEPGIRAAIRSDIGGDEQQIADMEVRYAARTYKHVLLPLWLSAFRFRDRVYRIMVNARTGEVTGERPYSALKILLAVVIGLGVVGGCIFIWGRSQGRW
ncbi:MAG: hypothetical protein IPL79_02530 [Myxococcales bacterium]|nr:hypothetical protein [Myxococcales bacterium]